jgi:uroporphyrinogen decarboxylase
MRQAGRYLPEYQKIRRAVGSFWTMCMTPDLAAEVTMQPIERFDCDAAILFSDILVIPYALGQAVRFEEGVGPILDEMPDRLIASEDVWSEKLAPVYDALRQTRKLLDKERALLGFAGGPLTLAMYMIEGKGSPDHKKAKLFAYRDPVRYQALIDQLVEIIAWHLIHQIDEGADAVQIFESWAEGLPQQSFERWVVAPTRRIVERVRARHPNARIIGFPRGATETGYRYYAKTTGVDAIGLDTAVSLPWAVAELGNAYVLQGNCDPLALIAGGEALDKAVDHILETTKNTPFIFNLGHGVLQETPVDHVAQLIARIRKGSA